MAAMLAYWCPVCGRERRTSAAAAPARCPVCVLSDRRPAARGAYTRGRLSVLAAAVVLIIAAACGAGPASVNPSTTPAPVPTDGYSPVTRTVVVMPEDLDRCTAPTVGGG